MKDDVMLFIPLFIPMVTFMAIAAFTPGPNNIMLAASGANFGFRRTIPHMLGVTVGFGVLLLLLGMGLDQLFQRLPLLQQGFRIAALCFIAYLAWGIANSQGNSKAASKGRPQYFLEATSFQLINPKGLVMAITVMSTFISPEFDFIPQYITLVICFMVITAFSVMVWAGFGIIISRFLNTPSRQRIFNITMALLLVLSILPVALDVLA
jgi:threonine/homoserine/homoserine lactone efflux protein